MPENIHNSVLTLHKATTRTMYTTQVHEWIHSSHTVIITRSMSIQGHKNRLVEVSLVCKNKNTKPIYKLSTRCTMACRSVSFYCSDTVLLRRINEAFSYVVSMPPLAHCNLVSLTLFHHTSSHNNNKRINKQIDSQCNRNHCRGGREVHCV